MKVSIIIPVYKVEPYIERCIQSVLRQTYRDLEVILVDDCTPDRSMELAKACIEQSPLSKDLKFVFLHHEQNQSVSVCRNDGIDAATGEYLMFIDSDDYITDDCVETLAKPLENFAYDIVAGNYELHDNGFGIQGAPLGLRGAIMQTKDIAESIKTYKLYCAVWNKLYNARFIKDNKIYFQKRLPYEDELWTALVVCSAKSMYAEQRITYHYEIRDGSFTTSETQEQNLPRCMRVLQSFYNEIEQRIPFLDVDAVNMIEERLIVAVKSAPKDFTPFKTYSCLRQCDTRSWKTKLWAHRSLKNALLHFDQYLPARLGYAYIKALYGTKLIKHRLHTLFS